MIKLSGFFKSKRVLVIAVCIICVLVLGRLLSTGGITKTNSIPDKKTGTAGTLFKYKTHYVGNNSKVVNLVNSLPYSDLRREVSLQTGSRPYGITVNYDFSMVNMDVRQVEPVLRNNAVIMFALIDNVDVINFNIKGGSVKPSYQYTRDKVQKGFTEDIREYAKDEETFQGFINSLAFRIYAYPEKYALTMSSTPGIRILVQYTGKASKVRYSTQAGTLLTWDNVTGKVKECGQSVELPYGTPVYWTPISDSPGSATVKAAVLDENNRMVGEKQASILRDSSTFYTVQLSPDVVIGVESKL